MSEAAEQLEAMAAEAKTDKGNVRDLIKKMETGSSDHQEGAREETELSFYKAKESSAIQLHHSRPLPLHPTTIKQESGCISEP